MKSESSAALVLQFGELVRSIRLSRGLSQEQLADLAGVHRTYIGMIERGEKNATLTTIAKFATALQVNIHDLIPGGASGE